MNTYEKRMLAILEEGRSLGIAAVKAEFEAEGTRSDELLRLLEIARRAGVGVGVKIGGCEAIRDLIECRQFGVDYVIAPMVETPYALSKFAAAIAKVFPADERADIGFLFNVETRTTFDQLGAMGELAGAHGIGMVFGRVDFASSMGRDRAFVNSAEMMDHVAKVALVARTRGLDMVVGGGVSAESLTPLRQVRAIRLDRYETRKIIFDAGALDRGVADEGLKLAIEFELLWLKNKRDHYRGIAAEDETRIAMMEARRQVEVAPPITSAAA